MRRHRCPAPIACGLVLAAALAVPGCAGPPAPRQVAAVPGAVGPDAPRPAPAGRAVPQAPDDGGAPDLAGWWHQQSRREAAERFWNDPRERRRALTRDQFELWDRQRERRLGRPAWPF